MSLHLSDETILALEASRDRQRRGQPSPPEPAESLPEPTSPPPLPEGSVVLSAREWTAVMDMVATHPETRETHHQTKDRF